MIFAGAAGDDEADGDAEEAGDPDGAALASATTSEGEADGEGDAVGEDVGDADGDACATLLDFADFDAGVGDDDTSSSLTLNRSVHENP
jgi:hypothetical protein